MSFAVDAGLLRKICKNSETLKKAKSILHLARARTGPGSGYSLGHAANSLPSICAYLASQELSNGDVTENVARVSACMDPRTFSKVVNVVQSALASVRSESSADDLYVILAQAYKLPSPLRATQWMEDVEARFLEDIAVKRRFDDEKISIKCAVFLWACRALEVDTSQEASLTLSYNISRQTLKSLVSLLDKKFDRMEDWVNAAVDEINTSPSSSSTVPSLPSQSEGITSEIRTASLTNQNSGKSSVKKRALGPKETSPLKKRRVDSLIPIVTPTVNDVIPKTVSNSQNCDDRFAIHRISSTDEVEAPSEMVPSTIPGPSTPRQSQSLQPSSPGDVNVITERQQGRNRRDASQLCRRFRPVFVEQQQWVQNDPKAAKIWQRAEEHKKNMVKLYGHPFEHLRLPDTYV